MIDQAATGPSALAVEGGTERYPIDVTYAAQDSYQRFWAIPAIGLLVKAVVVLPQLVIAAVLSYVVLAAMLVLWIPVLFTGRYPSWGWALCGGALRFTARTEAFLLGLTDQYPPFTFRSLAADGSAYKVQVHVEITEHSHRLWAVPALGLALKVVMLIPHAIIVQVLWYAVGVVSLVLWAWVLFGGRYPDWGMQLVGGTLRWQTRMSAYALGLTDCYPPFSLR